MTSGIDNAKSMCEIYKERGELDAGSQAWNIYHDVLKDYENARTLLMALKACQTTLHWVRDDASAPAWVRSDAGRRLIADVDLALVTAGVACPDSSSADSAPPSKDSAPQQDT